MKEIWYPWSTAGSFDDFSQFFVNCFTLPDKGRPLEISTGKGRFTKWCSFGSSCIDRAGPGYTEEGRFLAYQFCCSVCCGFDDSQRNCFAPYLYPAGGGRSFESTDDCCHYWWNYLSLLYQWCCKTPWTSFLIYYNLWSLHQILLLNKRFEVFSWILYLFSNIITFTFILSPIIVIGAFLHL